MSTLRRIFGLELLDNRYPSLHGLRVLAIVSVVQLHASWALEQLGMPLDPWFHSTSLQLFFGMDVFFVLSGFLIGSILLHSLENVGKSQLRRFYLRRIFRTFPAYWIVLTLLAVALPLNATQKSHLPYEYLYASTFIDLGFSDVVMPWGWSLALEEQFYLFVPLLTFLMWKLRTPRARVVLLLCITVSALVVRLGVLFVGGPWHDRVLYTAVYFRTYTRYDALIAGVLLAVVHRTWGGQIAEWLKVPARRAAILLTAMGLAWVCVTPTLFGDDAAQLVRMFAWGTLTSIMVFGVVTLLLHGDSWVHRALSAPIFRGVATLGYGVYLVHIPILQHVVAPAIAHVQHAHGTTMLLLWPLALVAVLALSLLAAYLLHVVVEKPSLRFRDRIAA